MFMCKIRVGELFLEENMCIELPKDCSAKESACNNRRHKRHGFDLGDREDAPEKEMATHSSILAWEIQWTEGPGYSPWGCKRVGHNLVTKPPPAPPHRIILNTKIHEKMLNIIRYCFCSVTKVCLTLQPHGLQHARFPCPSLSPGICSNSCPLSW